MDWGMEERENNIESRRRGKGKRWRDVYRKKRKIKRVGREGRGMRD